MLLKALPESIKQEVISGRNMSAVSIVFRVFKAYQPGGLAERGSLLKQLVEVRAPTNLGEWLTSLRGWRRWLLRLGELQVQPPDPVLLVGCLDRFAGVLTKLNEGAAFRIQVAKSALGVDVAPAVPGPGVEGYAEALMAEGEAACHAAMDTARKDTKKPAPEGSNPSSNQNGGKINDGKPPQCRFFLSDSGCRRGKDCTYAHESGSTEKQGRYWTCGAKGHMKPDCPTNKDGSSPQPKIKKESSPDTKKKVKKVEADVKKEETVSKPDGVKTTPSASSTVTITEVPEKGEGKRARLPTSSNLCQLR